MHCRNSTTLLSRITRERLDHLETLLWIECKKNYNNNFVCVTILSNVSITFSNDYLIQIKSEAAVYLDIVYILVVSLIISPNTKEIVVSFLSAMCFVWSYACGFILWAMKENITSLSFDQGMCVTFSESKDNFSCWYLFARTSIKTMWRLVLLRLCWLPRKRRKLFSTHYIWQN